MKDKGNEKQKILSMIGMARRAGKLEIGFDATKDLIKSGKTYTAFVAEDTSENTIKEIKFFIENSSAIKKVSFLKLPVTKDEIATYLMKPVGVFTITDKGISQRVCELAALSDTE